MNFKSPMGFDTTTAASLRMGILRSVIHIPTQTSTGPEYGCGSLRLDWLTGSRVFEVQLIGFRGACVDWCIYREGGCC
jgi:hypothetical protein